MTDRTLLTSRVSVQTALTVSASLGGSLQPQPPDPRTGPRVIPNDLADWLAALRLLAAVPFAYLVPDAELLPQESARFFYLDRAWTDALVQGAMSVGTVTTADHAQLEAVYPYVRDEVDEAERLARVAGHDPAPLGRPALSRACCCVRGPWPAGRGCTSGPTPSWCPMTRCCRTATRAGCGCCAWNGWRPRSCSR